jgi:hypothetical protein
VERELRAHQPTTSAVTVTEEYVSQISEFLLNWQKLNSPRLQGSNSGTLFSGLMNQKRNSGDAAAQARRQSFHDQKPAPGIIGKMWHKYVS